MSQINEADIKDRIFRHANHIYSARSFEDDAIFVHEKLIMADNSIRSNLRKLENYERSFWITKPQFRNHTQKKEREMMNKLQEFRSTQRNLVTNVKRALGNFYLGNTQRDVSNSLFLYGTDINVESIVSYEYDKHRQTDRQLKYEYGAYDTETYVADNEFMGDPIMASLVSNDIIQTTIHGHFLRQFGDGARDLITKMLYAELGDDIEAMGLSFELEIVDDPGQVAKRSIEKLHDTELDTVGVWNINFDIPMICKTLVKYGHSVDDVFSDPSVEPWYRSFQYVEGPTHRKSDAGKMFPLAPAERWHYAVHPAKWNLVDAMCVYADLRKAGGKEPYGLDPVLNKNIDRGKLKFDKANHLKGLEWHVYMQTNYPIEYVIYNIFDCLGMILLDNEIQDLSVNFPLLIGHTHISKAMSNPQKYCNNLHFRLLDDDEEPSVLGTTGRKENMILDIDDKLPDKRGWIMTLSADMNERCGVNFIADVAGLRPNVYIHVSDLDLEGTYPNAQATYNISKETTRYEVISIEGVGWEERRRWGVLMNAGEVNCIKLAHNLYKFPLLDTLLEHYKQDRAA